MQYNLFDSVQNNIEKEKQHITYAAFYVDFIIIYQWEKEIVLWIRTDCPRRDTH